MKVFDLIAQIFFISLGLWIVISPDKQVRGMIEFAERFNLPHASYKFGYYLTITTGVIFIVFGTIQLIRIVYHFATAAGQST